MEIVPFEIANKLNEKGFNEDCYTVYNTATMRIERSLTTWKDYKGVILAPTIAQVLKWLREHNIYIVVFINDDTDNPVTYEIYKGVECVMCEHKYYSLSEWNNAEIDAIEYALDRLL